MINISIFFHFFILGCFSFGGPIAHIGYFRKKFVEQLSWLSEDEFSKIVALSQFLPGPSSSQVGFTIGLKKGGILGAILAFIAFTLPSFIILYAFWYFEIFQNQSEYIKAIIYALKLFAVVIVMDAVLNMFKTFCKDKITILIFIYSSFILIFFASYFNQISILIISAIFGLIFIKQKSVGYSKVLYPNLFILIIFVALLILSFSFEYKNELLKLFFDFYKSGSLVFGGGHVILPLLQENLQNQVSEDTFLIAYSLAQTVPGPMFTISTYLGADIAKNTPLLGAIISTLGVFFGGFLLILAFYKSFDSLSKNSRVLGVIKGVNATVVAILFVTLIDTIIPNSIYNIFDIFLVILGFLAIYYYKVNIFYIILVFNLIFLVNTIL